MPTPWPLHLRLCLCCHRAPAALATTSRPHVPSSHSCHSGIGNLCCQSPAFAACFSPAIPSFPNFPRLPPAYRAALPSLQPPALSTLPRLVPSRCGARCRVMSPPCSATPRGPVPCWRTRSRFSLLGCLASGPSRVLTAPSLRVHFEEGFHLLPQVALDEPCKFPPLTLTHGIPFAGV